MIRHSRLTALGMMLCLLAALFAVEAKIAWFSPAGSASAQISYDKARPAEPPKALPERFIAPPVLMDAAVTAILAAVLLLAAATGSVITLAPDKGKVYAPSGFSASLSSRPPPVL